MLLKRLYEKDADGKPVRVNGVRILRAGARQNFSPDLVLTAIDQGWMAMADGKIAVMGENETVTYAVLRPPGYYCCHCRAPMPDGGAARVHIETKHAEESSPDRQNPAGYQRINHYECERVT